MDRETLEGMLIDYIDNKLNTVDRQRIEQELVNNPASFKLYEELKELIQTMERSSRLEPSAKLGEGFQRMLNEEVAATRKSRTIFFQPAFYRAAAAVALLVIGGSVGFWINQKNEQRMAQDRERLELLEEEMRITREMMAKLNNDQSASQRIQGVNVALTMTKPADMIVSALVKTMNEDPNSNVRLAALEALSKFIDENHVREALITSLPKQKDPIVQIQLIQLLVKMKEKGVVDELQNIVDDEGTMQAVKDEAYTGILKLS